MQDQAEHHAGHRDGGADLRDGRAADGAVGEQPQVEHRLGRTALVPDERGQREQRTDGRPDGHERDPAVLDAAGERVAAEADRGDAEDGAREVEPVVGEVLGAVGRDTESARRSRR